MHHAQQLQQLQPDPVKSAPPLLDRASRKGNEGHATTSSIFTKTWKSADGGLSLSSESLHSACCDLSCVGVPSLPPSTSPLPSSFPPPSPTQISDVKLFPVWFAQKKLSRICMKRSCPYFFCFPSFCLSAFLEYFSPNRKVTPANRVLSLRATRCFISYTRYGIPQ